MSVIHKVSGSGKLLADADRLKLVYWNEDSGTGRVEQLDDDGRVVDAVDMKHVQSAVPCFTAGAALSTKTGPRLAEDLRPGDLVATRDHGQCPILWIGRKTFDWRQLGVNPLLRPVCIRAGALGAGLPERDLIVSPNHRLLVARRTETGATDAEAFINARDLVGRPGIEIPAIASVCYFQFLFSHHEVVLADGCWSESFQPDQIGLGALDTQQQAELGEVLPELKEGALPGYRLAREVISSDDVAELLA